MVLYSTMLTMLILDGKTCGQLPLLAVTYFTQGQEKEYENASPIRRITQNIRDKVEMHCYSIYGIPPGEKTLEELGVDPVDFRKMCKTYVTLENDFRSSYREAIEKRIRWLEDSDDRLDTL